MQLNFYPPRSRAHLLTTVAIFSVASVTMLFIPTDAVLRGILCLGFGGSAMFAAWEYLRRFVLRGDHEN